MVIPVTMASDRMVTLCLLATTSLPLQERSLEWMESVWTRWTSKELRLETTHTQQQGENVVKESLHSHQYECSGVQQQSDQVWLPDGLIQCTGICPSEMEETSICVRTHTSFHAPQECAGFHMTGN
jgi:hypothetical protein